MRRSWEAVRSVLLWTAGVVHFGLVTIAFVAVSFVVDPRRYDRIVRFFARNVLRLMGVRLETRLAPGFDRTRTSLFVCNHVNIFDPFVVYSSIPQFFRGLELESHFDIPVYGWLMRRFGNIAVADEPGPKEMVRMYKRVKEALDAGTSLIVFAEGSRTLDGRVGEFQTGVFRMAIRFGYPIVPMSVVGAFEFQRKGSKLLRPGRIVVHIHGTVETAGLGKEGVDALRDRVRAAVAKPVDEYYAAPPRPPHDSGRRAT
ncbi:MAG: lysophospholipid acyltransferase family protein [Planctomycetota bacterium]